LEAAKSAWKASQPLHRQILYPDTVEDELAIQKAREKEQQKRKEITKSVITLGEGDRMMSIRICLPLLIYSDKQTSSYVCQRLQSDRENTTNLTKTMAPGQINGCSFS
jgi:hypothetical protein